MKKQLTDAQRAELLRWAERLESGEYAQCTRGRLRDEREQFVPPGRSCTFCCLGVYADVAGPGPTTWSLISGTSLAPFLNDEQVGLIDGDAEYLYYDWMEERTGISRDQQVRLADLNDSKVQFSDIAARLRSFAETGEWPGE